MLKTYGAYLSIHKRGFLLFSEEEYCFLKDYFFKMGIIDISFVENEIQIIISKFTRMEINPFIKAKLQDLRYQLCDIITELKEKFSNYIYSDYVGEL